MPLSGVLSALRELILDDIKIPETQAARLELFGSLFRNLDPEEVEDLAKIEPAQLRIYTGTIFAGERSVLGNHFPLTFALISSAWQEVYQKPFNKFQFIKDLHRAKPWTSNTTKQLALNFQEYLQTDCADLQDVASELSDSCSLEMMILEISRQKERDLQGVPLLTVEQISQLTVADLLSRTFILPRCARFIEFRHDVISMRREYLDTSKLQGTEVRTEPLRLVGARNRFAQVRWLELRSDMYDYLKGLSAKESHRLENLAGVFVENLIEEHSEHEQFSLFYRSFIDLLTVGAVVLTD